MTQRPPDLHVVDDEFEPFQEDEAGRPEFSDDALMLIFANRHGNMLRYVALWIPRQRAANALPR